MPRPDPDWLSLCELRVELRRSPRRRTVALWVGPQGAVLYAPSGVPRPRLEGFLHEREGWLRGHLSRFAGREPRQPPGEGSPLPLLDGELTLHLRPGLRAARREGELLLAGTEDAGRQLENWYREQALAYFGPLVGEYARRLGGAPGRLRLTNASGRWGSCSANGDIRLHWRLMLAPQRVADYVAAHEVAHLLELNHSVRYWATLARLLPDYREPRAWLRGNGHELSSWGTPGGLS
ncbi:MAG: M48 family metallopeptidase [Deinococcus sp.]